MRLNKKKCFFLRSSIEYLEHMVDKDGIHPTEEKVKAIKEAQPQLMLPISAHFCGYLLTTTNSSPISQLHSLLSTLFLTSINAGVGMTSSSWLFNKPKQLCSLMLSSSITIRRSHWCWHVMPPTTALELCCHILLMLVKNVRLHTSLVHSHQPKSTILNLRKKR